MDCNNLPDFEDERAEARQSALVKNPQAFTNKIARRSTVSPSFALLVVVVVGPYGEVIIINIHLPNYGIVSPSWTWI